jgi:hypothetical protein
MTERRDRKKITHVRDLVAQLPEQEHLDLGNSVGAGLFNARMAAKCLTDPDSQHENILQMMTYLTAAINELQKARDIIQKSS